MQTKRLIIAMAVMTALILGWGWFTEYMYSRHPEWRRPGEPRQPVAATQPAPADAAATPAAPPPPATASVGAATTSVAPAAAYRAASGEPRRVTIGSDERAKDNPIRMQLTLSATGAGIDRVVLNGFDAAEPPGENQPRAHYSYQEPFRELENLTRPLATTGVTINGQSVNIAAAAWTVAAVDDTSATFTLDILSGDRPVARLHKTYRLTRADDPGLGYEVKVEQRIENLSVGALVVNTALNGPVPPVREMLSMDDRQVLAAYNVDGKLVIQPHFPAAFKEDHPTLDLSVDSKNNRIVWFGASSVYFNAIVRPTDPARIAAVSATALNPASAAADRLVALDFTTADLTLAPGAGDGVAMNVFLGPKKRDILNSAYYIAAGLNQTLGTLNSGCANWCTAQWIIDGLVWLLGLFHWIFRDWGLAIICLVVVVRGILHPITKRSTISMHKMGKMGPEMERLKKKYGDNKEELNKAMMQLYKEQGATPILGCLPMFLQMPIWIALWSALQNTMELRQAGFLHWENFALTWIDDLSKPDALLSWTPVPLLFGWKLGAINVLPILMGVVFFLQQKFTPKPAAATPEQAQQQKMMLWMTVLLFPLFLYNGPSGLNLYILTSTTIGIIEMRRIRKHIQEREEREKLEGPVKVEVSQSRMGKKLARERGPAQPPKSGLAKWLADLQQKAEELRNEQQRRQRGK